MKVIELYNAVDTMKIICDFKDIRLKNCDTIQMLQNEKINMQQLLIETSTSKLDLCKAENKGLKKVIRNRSLLLIGSAILNSILIIKFL